MTTGIPVVCVIERVRGALDFAGAMKNTKRLILGLASSLLLAVGFARAADKLDPLNRDLEPATKGALASTEACVQLCHVIED